MRPCVFLFAALLTPASLLAEVADASATGFTIKLSFPVQALPADLYRSIIKVGDWWASSHTFSGDSHNLTIDDQPGGCFCEKMPDHGGVRHMEVIAAIPGKRLVLSGTLGPLQSLAATGTMTFQISPAEGESKLDVVYAVAGYLPAGMNTWAAPVDGVLKLQITRLKNLIERGKP